MIPEQKTKTQIISEKETAPSPKKNNNAVIWVLVGCFGVILIAGLIILGLAIWGGWHLKKRINEAHPEFKKWQETADQMEGSADQSGGQTDSIDKQMESASGSIPQTAEEPAGTIEKAVGYVRNVYEKGGKRYLVIDYIQWLTGSAAEKAMREDGECSSAGECIVANDYYIRNQNPRLRTFEISPQAKIYSQTIGMNEGGFPQDKEISYETFKDLFNSPPEWEIQNNPYAIELSSGAITKITQYYIP